MLRNEELLAWCKRLGLRAKTCDVISEVRSRGPTRAVGGGGNNVSGRYPSRKMGVTIQFESHRVELPFIYEMEHDSRVLEYYDQPPSIPLLYQAKNGRRLSVLHTPDFFVIREHEAGWEECKTESDLEKLAEKSPHRYQRDSAGRWRCPPGEAHGIQCGLYYRVRSSAEINWTLQQNLHFLDDYLRFDAEPRSLDVRESVMAEVASQPALLLSDLIERMNGVASRDDIYFMIANGEISVDLSAAPISQTAGVHLFANAGLAAAFHSLDVAGPARPVRLVPGESIAWDSRVWRIANLGDEIVSLISDDTVLTELPRQTFENLASSGRLAGMPALSERNRILTAAAEADLRLANRRFELVKRHLNGDRVPVPARTLRFWSALYRHGREAHGSGYLGLVPKTALRGNRTAKLPEETRALMEEFIKQDYETLKQKSKLSSWAVLKARCEERKLTAPSYKTFCALARERPVVEQKFKRCGRRAAYSHSPFFFELDLTTPRHGDRPFEIGHIDHTELDVELVCSLTGRCLGRPWMTILVDAFSRRGLAVYLTFDPPSYRACMMILRECVRRHARLPEIIVIDGGAEFRSTYFETLLARYECTKKTRPPAKPRFGSVCERLFGTTNTQFIHNLRGNTQIMRNVRQVTKSVNPQGLAAWTLGDLHERVCEYLYEIYDTIHHPALGQSPREAFEAGLEQGGLRAQRRIAYDQEFLMATLPTTQKGTARVMVGRGVKINQIYYWSDTFRLPGIENGSVPVRYDPFDLGTAYAFVRNQWVQCRSEHFGAFQGRSEKEVLIASREIQKRLQEHARQEGITARRLADFLLSIESEEVLLLQRLRDRNSTAARSGPEPAAIWSGSGGEDQPCGRSGDLSEDIADLQAYGEFR